MPTKTDTAAKTPAAETANAGSHDELPATRLTHNAPTREPRSSAPSPEATSCAQNSAASATRPAPPKATTTTTTGPSPSSGSAPNVTSSNTPGGSSTRSLLTLDNPRVKQALILGQVPRSAWLKELRRVEKLVAKETKVKNPLAYALSVITNYANDPIWEETPHERIQRGRTAYEPG